MGLTKLNNKMITAPDRTTVAELKRLGDISALDRIYELQTGRVLEDNDLIDPRNAAYGSTTDWERGRAEGDQISDVLR